MAKKVVMESNLEDNTAKYPPIKLPKKEEANHTPINMDINLAGANLVTMDKPTGDKHSSPQV